MPPANRADGFPVLPPERAARWARFAQWETVYFPKFLGLVVEEIREGYARMRLPYRPEFRQPAGVLHGGVLASMADTVVVPAIGSAYDEPRVLLTVDMQIRYLAAIEGEDAVAEGWVTRRGRSLVFCDAEIAAASGIVAATATLVYKVSSREPAGDAT